MALPESRMREIRLELYGHAKAIADAIEEIGAATRQKAIVEARWVLLQAKHKFEALARDAESRALRSKR